MQYSWLEKLTKEGHVREEIKDKIYQDCSVILEKLGNAPAAAAAELGPVETLVRNHVNLLGTVGFLGAASYLGKTIFDKIHSASEVADMIKNKASVLSCVEGATHKEKASARFDELVRYAPRVATMPDLSKRLVLGALHTGFTDADVQRLAAMQASYSDRPKEPQERYKQYQKKITKTSAERAADVINIVKEATPGTAGGAAKNLLATIAALTGAHLTIGLGAGVVNTVRGAMDKKNLEANLKKSFDEAMKQSDPNREPLHANKEKARQAFQTLVHFAPHMAVEPSAARAFMNSMVSHDLGVGSGSVKELSEIERNLKGTKGSNPFFEGLNAGLESTQFGSQLNKAIQTGMDPITEHLQGEVAGGLYGMHRTKPTYSLPEEGPVHHGMSHFLGGGKA